MKRYKLKSKKRFYTSLTFIVLIMALGISLIIDKPDAQGEGINEFTVYTVQNGDTLWDIAQQYNKKHKDLREYVYMIQKENGIFGDKILPNQQIRVPNEK